MAYFNNVKLYCARDVYKKFQMLPCKSVILVASRSFMYDGAAVKMRTTLDLSQGRAYVPHVSGFIVATVLT